MSRLRPVPSDGPTLPNPALPDPALPDPSEGWAVPGAATDPHDWPAPAGGPGDNRSDARAPDPDGLAAAPDTNAPRSLDTRPQRLPPPILPADRSADPAPAAQDAAPLHGSVEALGAEVALLRAELDLLRQAFRRHCLETG